MSNPMSWQINGAMTEKQFDDLVALNPRDLESAGWDDSVICFDTDSFGAVSRIRHALEEWAAMYPEITALVQYMYECAWNPDGFMVAGGKVRDVSGKVKFTYDDTGEEVMGQ